MTILVFFQSKIFNMTVSKLTFLVCMFYFLSIHGQDLAMYCLVFDLAYGNFSRTKGLLNKSMWFSQLSFRKKFIIISND